MKYAIGSNTSGYMPDSEAYTVIGQAQALDALRNELILTIESFDGFDDTNVLKYDDGWVDRAVTNAKKQLKTRKQANIWVGDRIHWAMPV